MIHVCFGLHDKTGRYSKFTGTAMLSIFENLSPPPQSTCIHILHDNTLTTDNRDKFIYLAGRYNQLVKFYNVEQICADKLEKIKQLSPSILESSLSIATFYRLLIPQVLSVDIEKVIYLDSDIIVNLDIKELWQIELGDSILGAADELRIDLFIFPANASANYLSAKGFMNRNDYFNSGVLLMDLNILRGEAENILRGIKFVGENPQLKYFDQDTLNYLYSKSYLKLDEKFNDFVRKARRLSEMPARKIYHYASGVLGTDTTDPFNRLWLKYFIRTPWFDEDSIGRLYGGVQHLHVNLKNLIAKISGIVSGKTRAFFILPQYVNLMRNYFAVHDDEEIILAENQNSLQKLLDAMNSSRGKKVFFILVPYFPLNILTQAGFVIGRDFINGIDFLSELHGFPLNSHELIKAM